MTSEPATVASATRWGGAAVMVALVAVVVAAPLVADALLPDTVVAAGAQGRIGVYERVTFTEAGPSGDVVAGVIAPEGWRWVESRASGSFLSADGGSAITVGLRTGIADSAGLLREGIPVGAVSVADAGAPPGAPAGLDSAMLEYDLSAGGAPSVRIVACRPGAGAVSCLTIDAVFRGTDGADRDAEEAALRRVLASAEVIG